MKRQHIFRTVAFIALIFSYGIHGSFAQKLPNKQEVGVHAPTNVKIDGKAAEWGQLQAINNATSLKYTIANDAQNLYFVFQTDDPATLFKITNKGIRVNINADKKDDKNSKAIKYPYFDGDKKPYISFRQMPKPDPSKPESVRLADSVMNSANKKMGDLAKFIKVSGLAIPDAEISIYNDIGIQLSQSFSNNLTYTAEWKIPLKLLGLSVDGPQKFNVHVTVAGIDVREFMIETVNERGTGGSVTLKPGVGTAMPTADQRAATAADTDFWAEYTLIK